MLTETIQLQQPATAFKLQQLASFLEGNNPLGAKRPCRFAILRQKYVELRKRQAVIVRGTISLIVCAGIVLVVSLLLPSAWPTLLFVVGWIGFYLLQNWVNYVLSVKKLVYGEQLQIDSRGLGMARYGGFRFVLIGAFVLSFFMSLVFHINFFFSAGILFGWMVRTYWYQIKVLGIHYRLIATIMKNVWGVE